MAAGNPRTLVASNMEASGGGLGRPKARTFPGVGEQGFLAELLGDVEEASAEVHRGQGVLGEQGDQAQQMCHRSPSPTHLSVRMSSTLPVEVKDR
ncbi:hypothetical protein EYF80_054822 [Liparis tanakae]|uniref:Uncharacterized protein n=1 Tax=Liparis tanakae TaxID=230148 RepID=A0A4Z2F299_9TELE|nr:hypothetical protein EYF80_054822 [Liparis tanakae]